MNDTPRTDAGVYYPDDNCTAVVDAELARTLERELAAAQAKIDGGILPYEAREFVAEALYELMSDISEDCYCAGWTMDNEFWLWDALNDPADERRYGRWAITDQQIAVLRVLSTLCDGWWAWPDKERVFMRMEAWRSRVAKIRGVKEEGNG
jgi:hypothetical protein